ncbi:hypothetical protein [Vibrio aphrogenes]|uniref:hypothetical protein n=1 Tax=Vibrio aphrogenes TaxID=1891186 RepID=UPI000B350B17|nr:hypothetical protein [Vibrio aphrogenes]
MKVVIQYTQTGMYKDSTWGNPSLRTKGQLQAVEPAFAATLIKNQQAHLQKNQQGDIIIER